MKFASKSALLVFTIISVGFVLVCSTVFCLVRQVMKEEITRNNNGIAAHFLKEIDKTMYGAGQDICLIAANEAFREYLENKNGNGRALKDVSRVFDNIFSLTGPWDSLMLINKDGIIALSSREKNIGEAINKYPESNSVFRRCVNSKYLFYSDLILSDLNAKPTVIFASPVLDEAGEQIIGVVLGHFSWPVVMQILDNAEKYQHIHLYNKEGEIIGTPICERDLILKRKYAVNEICAEIHPEHAKGKVIISKVSEVGFLNYKGNGWSLLLETPTSVAFASVNYVLKNLVMYFSSGILIITAVLFLVGRRYVNPLKTLVKAAESVGNGNFDAQIKFKSNDEIGFLADSFSSMLERLRKNTTTINRLNEEIVERRKAEEALEKSILRTQLAIRARELLFANITHEFCTPLNSVIGFSSLMLDDSTEALTEKQKEYLNHIKMSGEQLFSLFNSVLDVSRIEIEGGQAVYSDFLLKDIFNQVVVLFQDKIKSKQIRTVVEIAGDVSGIVRGDEKKIKWILYLLLSNAVKFVYPAGTIIFKAERASASDNKEMLEVAVIDSGIGINREDLELLFEVFGQLDVSIRKEYSGIGMGLVLARKLVESCGGTIRAESEGLGKGSVFKFTFPFEKNI